MLEEQLLPIVRYYAYVEVPDLGSRLSTLGAAYRRIEHPHFAMRQVHDRGDIYPVFRALFSEKANQS